MSAIRFAADLTLPDGLSPELFPSDDDEDGGEVDSILRNLLVRIAQIKGLADPNPEYIASHICTADDHQSTLHGRVQGLLTLNDSQCAMFKRYMNAVGVSLGAEEIRGLKLTLWKKCLRNDPETPQGLCRAYIRSANYEKPGCRDSTYIRYEIMVDSESDDSQSDLDTVSRFGRVKFFCSYMNAAGAKQLMAYIQDIPVVYESIGAEGSRRLYRTKEEIGLPQKKTGANHAECLFINADNIGALMGLVVINNVGYLIEKDTCFLG
jgi:hypothetical protein